MANDDTGFRKIIPIGGDGDREAHGLVDPVRVTEPKPCMACKSFEKDEARLRRYLAARGAITDPATGRVKMPKSNDYHDAVPHEIDPRDFGFCRFWTWVVDILASCEKFVPMSRVKELARRL